MNMITRCPACETSFRITEAQLSTAKGAVRCGSCLHIFKALDNLVPPRAEAKTPAPAAEPKPEVAPAPKNSADTPRFEYRRPAPVSSIADPRHGGPIGGNRDTVSQPKPTTPSTSAVPTQASPEARRKPERAVEETSNLAIAPDNWEDVRPEGIPAEMGESRLRFDQAVIDEDDGSDADGIYADDLLISDEMALEEEDENFRASSNFGDENFIALDNWKPADKSLFDRGPRAPRRADEDDDFDPDESWAMDLLDEEEEAAAPHTAPKKSHDPAPASGPFNDLDIVHEDDEQGESDYGDYSPDNTGTFAVHEDKAEDHAFADDEFDGESIGSDESTFAWNDEALDENESALHHDGYEPIRVEESDRRALLNRIEPEPVEFAIDEGRDWGKTLLWGGLSALGLVLLLVQVAWLQFDRLSRQPPYRDFYAVVCPLVGCELPSLSAPEMIRTSNLVVRSHPQAEGALMVDTILLNRAPFQQPFPDLVLTFSNIHGETLAARRFTPSEYLAGELAGQTSMPSNQPIHLSLEIVDPGPNAVNYSAYIPQ